MGIVLERDDAESLKLAQIIRELIARRDFPIAGISFAEQLLAIRRRINDIYFRITVDLSVARTLEKVSIAGAGIFVRSATNDPDATLDIRLWRSDLPAIPIRMQSRVEAPFDEFYLTNTAQAGKTLDLFISKEPDIFRLIEAPSLDANILAELQGSTTGTDFTGTVTTDAQIRASNVNRKSILINADPTNTVDLMIGDSAAVAAGAAAIARLKPGQSWAADDYRGAVFGEAADALTSTRFYGFEVGV